MSEKTQYGGGDAQLLYRVIESLGKLEVAVLTIPADVRRIEEQVRQNSTNITRLSESFSIYREYLDGALRDRDDTKNWWRREKDFIRSWVLRGGFGAAAIGLFIWLGANVSSIIRHEMYYARTDQPVISVEPSSKPKPKPVE